MGVGTGGLFCLYWLNLGGLSDTLLLPPLLIHSLSFEQPTLISPVVEVLPQDPALTVSSAWCLSFNSSPEHFHPSIWISP